jgi:alkylation response protein AidB-like acyl-CoA dehydrogenase
MIEFGLSESQRLLRMAARKFFTDKCPSEFVREMENDSKGYSSQLWREMANLGMLGLVIPEEFDGQESTFIDLVILLEEIGRVLLPSPFIPTVVLGALAILKGGTSRQKQDLLPRVARGDIILTLALDEPGVWCEINSLRTQAIPTGDGFIIKGTKLFVLDAHIADYIICVAKTAENKIALFLVDGKTPGIRKTLLKTIAADKQFEVIFDNVRISKGDILGIPNEGETLVKNLLECAAIAKCAEMVGGAQRVFEMCIGYCKERIQFGKPIGSFQAIQHHIANMAIDLEGARWVTYQAAWLLSNEFNCLKEVAIAKIWTNEVYKRIVNIGHQIHGGYSITMDHDVQLYFRRAKASEVAYGDTNHFLRTIGSNLGF